MDDPAVEPFGCQTTEVRPSLDQYCNAIARSNEICERYPTCTVGDHSDCKTDPNVAYQVSAVSGYWEGMYRCLTMETEECNKCLKSDNASAACKACDNQISACQNSAVQRLPFVNADWSCP